MKKFILAAILVLFLASTANAAWSFRFGQHRMAKNYIKWFVILTSDTNALTAVDLLARPELGRRLKSMIQGASLMLMKVVPGTGSAKPTTTIDIQLEDEENHDLWAKTGISANGMTWHKLWEDIGSYPPILTELNVVINDIGGSGDEVTLYFICWIENP